ncbi:MAG: hypothetical protein ACKVQS_01710 [Fimbriimonadaceae bacterium]
MIIRNLLRAATAALVLGIGAVFASAADLYVEWDSSRSPAGYGDVAEAAVRNLNLRMALLSEQRLSLDPHRAVFSVPTRIILTKNCVPLPTTRVGGGRSSSGDIVLSFDTSGSRAFPSDYKTQLESTYAASKSTMDTVFGPASVGGSVKVLNYDADIPARQAVSGGFYIPNAPGGPEIRFPVYQSATSAGINFVHTLLLAYMETKSYPYDAWNEGLVRAATMRIARVPNTIPNSTAGEIEQTLDSLYDSSAVYPWSNYPGLGAPVFIAANLLSDPLPVGGSTGGIYLLRYKMAGTAWAKVLVEYPGFVAAFNDYYQRAVSSYQSEAGLSGLGQGVINLLAGHSGATIEGLSFADWVQRQSILDTSVNPGLNLVPEAFPFVATGATSDFGVFGIVLNAFKTSPNGDETLLSGTSFPIYWRKDFTRFFTTAQDDVISIAGGYGSVVPNFPKDSGNNQIYRTAVDLPYQGKNVRLYLPAGAYSTGANPAPNNVYGTIVGFDDSTVGMAIKLTWPGGFATLPVFNGSFGGSIIDPNFALEQKVTVDLINAANSSLIQTMTVNKGRGDLAIDFRSTGSYPTYSTTVTGRMQGISIPFEPLRPNPAKIFGLNDNQMLLARWNSFTGRYQFYPDDGEIRQGLGYFVRPPVDTPISVRSRTSEKTPLAVSLVPGWNMVSVPMNSTLTTTNVLVTTSTQAISTWAEGADILVGSTFYRYNPDPTNTDLGTLVPATTFVPGQSYYVRALSNDGAVLIFGPPASSSLVASHSALLMGQKMANQGTARILGRTTGITPGAWRSKLEITTTQGHYSVIELGQSALASAGYDQLDQPLPTGPGGFQASLEMGGALFREMKPPLRGDVFTVTLAGLVPGRRYTILNTPLLGSTTVTIFGLGSVTSISPYGQTSFVAGQSKVTLQVVNR